MKAYSSGIRHDYKDSPSGTRNFHPRDFSLFAAGLVVPLVAVMLLLFSESNQSMVPSQTESPGPAPIAIAFLPSNGERVPLTLPPLTSVETDGQLLRPEDIERSVLLTQGQPLMLTVKNGDTLDRLFRRNDLSISDLAAMVALPDARNHLARIRPGDKIEVIHDGERILSLSREVSESQRLWIKRDSESFTSGLIDLESETRTAGAHGTVQSSLWEAASDAGLDYDIIGEIAGIFAWDIDFLLDVRSGDSFTVVYEEIWRDGVKLRNGQIVAAEYVNQGKSYRAARYADSTGNVDYFTPEGMSVRRPFLRAPLEFSRVSSNFNPNRKHPILNTIRAHRGVDYAAPTGTPVQAAGDGKIVARGANGSFGNRVEIQHGGNITTLYAHLSKFGRFKVGERVKQGDIIGYVGMTGGATGPHLHYEYRIAGVHQNPRTVDLPDAQPIPTQYREDFLASTTSLWHQLDLYQSALLAENVE